MKRVVLATSWFFTVRVVCAALVATPLGLALRSISMRHPDGDDALFAELLPRLGDVVTREPRTLLLSITSLLLLALLAPLGEAWVDRTGSALLAGRRATEACGDAVGEAFRLGGVSLFSGLFRGAALACVIGLFRYRELSMPALALPATISFLLGCFVGLVLALRDLLFWPSQPTLRGRLRVGLLVLVRFPLRMIVLALGSRALSFAFTSVALVASTSPARLHGFALVLLYALVAICFAAAALSRALRFSGFGALAERVRPEGERTDDRPDGPDAPSLDPAA